MSIVKIYKILTFILLPIVSILGVICLLSLIMALGNPSILLPLSMLICTVIYVFTSNAFLQKGLLRGMKCNPSLKDWIKVNAYVTMFFASMSVMQFVTFIFHPDLLQQFTSQAMAMQKDMPSDAMVMMPKVIRSVMYFILTFGLLLLAHIAISLSFLKQYGSLFEDD